MGKFDTCQVICHNARILDYPTFHFNKHDKHAEIKQLEYSKGCLSEKISIYKELTIHEACIQVFPHYVPSTRYLKFF